MCRITDALRWALGIRPYVWKSALLPRWYEGLKGVRGGVNGTARAPSVYWTTHGLTPEECRILKELECDQQAIRQIVSELVRRRAHEAPRPPEGA